MIKKIIIGGFSRLINRNRSSYRKIGINFIAEKILKHNDSIELKKIKINDKIIYYNDRLSMINCIDEIFFQNTYNFITETQNSKIKIIDCGAYIGLSILYFKELFPNSEIIGFEPDPQNFDTLSKNIESFGYNNIEIYNKAIWINNEDVSFSQTGTMSSSINGLYENVKKINVQSIRLKDLLIDRIDLLKIDIEGVEYDVIKDCSENLKFADKIFIEYHGFFNESFKLIELLEILNKNEFNFYIKEAANIYKTPFNRNKNNQAFDLQLNIFAFKKN
jgi:FkbM family methyltransferase